MTISIEKALVKSNFYELLNTPNIMKYVRYSDKTSQFIIEFNTDTNKWDISFPLNNDSFNYRTSFNDYKKLSSYALERIREFKKIEV
jgi:hypothetical protein